LTTGIALLRGINVGGNNKIKMELLRSICESLDLKNVQTYVQSGNVVFQTKRRDLAPLGPSLEAAIEAECGFRPPVILRTIVELEQIVSANPFEARPDLDPAKLLVTFFPVETSPAAQNKILSMSIGPEELCIRGREHYTYFPNGQGQSKYPAAAIDKAVGARGTGRNWNTVLQLLQMGQ
jgi:uncharacterized protein (DUF1697 family)